MVRLSQIILQTSSYRVILLHDLETICTSLKIGDNAIYDIQLRFVKFDAQAHMWLDTLLASGSFLYNLSWTFSCPLHCGGDRLSPFIAGFSSGSLCGFLLALWLLTWRFQPAPSPAAPARPSFLPRSQPRLSAYLYE